MSNPASDPFLLASPPTTNHDIAQALSSTWDGLPQLAEEDQLHVAYLLILWTAKSNVIRNFIIAGTLPALDSAESQPHYLTNLEFQYLMDLIQKWLDRNTGTVLLRRSAIYLLYHMIMARLQDHIRPKSLMVQGCNFDRSRKSMLGTGGDSFVYRGSYEGRAVAVKEVRVVDALSTQDLKIFYREAITWRQLKHSSLLEFTGLIDGEPVGFYLVAPFMPKTLRAYVAPGPTLVDTTTPGGYRAEVDRDRLMREIAEGLAYLHAHKVVHGDVKDKNILIDELGHAKVADFGLAIVGDSTDGRFTTTGSGKGSPGWQAPERYQDDEARRAKPVDVFAFACICFAIITGVAPFEGYPPEKYVSSVVLKKSRRSRPLAAQSLGRLEVSDHLWETIMSCWSHTPAKRLTMRHVLACLDVESSTIYQPENRPYFTTTAARSYKPPLGSEHELTIKKGEAVEVLNGDQEEWLCRNADGLIGDVSHRNLEDCTIITAETVCDVAGGNRDEELPTLGCKKGELLEVLAFRHYRWIVRNSKQRIGLVSARYLKPNWDPDNRFAVGQATLVTRPLADYTGDSARHQLTMRRRERKIRLLYTPLASEYFVVRIDDKTGIVPSYFLEPVVAKK